MTEIDHSGKISVPVFLAPEVHSSLSQFAEDWGIEIGDFLAMSGLDKMAIELVIEKGYEILGRNESKEEITYSDILYGSDAFDETPKRKFKVIGGRDLDTETPDELDDDLDYVDNVRLFKQKSE